MQQNLPSSGKQPSCMEMLQAIIDGDATHEQQVKFKEHIDECMPCYKKYNLEITIKELVKSKCCGNGAPPDLIDSIKNHIKQNPTV
jgi:mycothiol system anti-sigma-R factor